MLLFNFPLFKIISNMLRLLGVFTYFLFILHHSQDQEYHRYNA